MQFLILSLLASTASAQFACTETDEILVRCPATTKEELKKCTETSADAATGTAVTKDGSDKCGAGNAALDQAAVITEIGQKHCKLCVKKKFECGADTEDKPCPIAAASDTDPKKKADFQKCYSTTFVKVSNEYVRNVKVSATPFHATCGHGTVLNSYNVLDCRKCVAKEKTPSSDDEWKCAGGEEKKACKFVANKKDENAKCYKAKKKTQIKCVEADGEDCKKCSAAYMGLFLAFAALLL